MKYLRYLFVFICLFSSFHFIQGCGGSGGKSAKADFDLDGIPNDIDDDDDGDGVIDTEDAFPFDPSETTDTDGDGIGDNADNDADNDGFEKAADCNDINDQIFPGAPDSPDDEITDANCDGTDGDITLGIWVSTSEGNDSNDGSFENPVKTISKAIDLAKTLPLAKRRVHIVAGTYAEDIILTDNVSLYGGYDLLSDGKRQRNLTNKRAEISGVDLDKNVNVTFGSGPFQIFFTLFINTSDSIVDGLIFRGDISGINGFVLDSNATVKNSEFIDHNVSAARDVSLGLTVVIGSSSNIQTIISNNQFTGKGTGNPSHGIAGGIMGFPLHNADGSLKLNISNNQMSFNGLAEDLAAIFVADDDNDPTDDPNGDGLASVNLTALNNKIDIQGLYDGAGAIVTGKWAGGTILPDADLIYSGEAIIENNEITLDVTADGAIGVNVALARQESRIVNNMIAIKGNGGAQIGVIGLLSALDILQNSIALTGNTPTIFGLAFLASETTPEFAAYQDRFPGRILNNIFSMSASSGFPGCSHVGIYEDPSATTDSYAISAVSPQEIKNNLFNLDSSCTNKFFYSEKSAAATLNTVTTLDDLNDKVGFAPTDPTEIEDNISGDPLFIDPDTGDLRLDDISPAIDAGATISDVKTDKDGVARPQNDFYDIGATEQ